MPLFYFIALHSKQERKDFLFSPLLFLRDQYDCSKDDYFFLKYVYAVYMHFESSLLTLAALCSFGVQPGRCSQRGSSMRAGAARTARRSKSILRVSKTNEPVWRAAQAAEVLHLFQSQQRFCQEAGCHINDSVVVQTLQVKMDSLPHTCSHGTTEQHRQSTNIPLRCPSQTT